MNTMVSVHPESRPGYAARKNLRRHIMRGARGAALSALIAVGASAHAFAADDTPVDGGTIVAGIDPAAIASIEGLGIA